MTLKKIAAATALIAGVMGSTAFAQDKEQVEGAKLSGVDTLYFAEQLAQMGLESNDAILVAAAAKLKQSIVTEKTEFDRKTGGAEASGDKPAAASSPMSADALYAKAAELAGSNKGLKGAIQTAASTKMRGAVGGAKEGEHRVEAHDYDLFSVKFRGERTAKVYVEGDGDTDLDLYIYDENDNEICTDTDTTDTMYCEWNPRWTGEFTIKIKNLGSVYNEYYIMTN